MAKQQGVSEVSERLDEVRPSRVARVQRVTVRTLMEALQRCPPDSEVLVSRDAEGNSIHPFHQLSIESRRNHSSPAVVTWPMHDEVDL